MMRRTSKAHGTPEFTIAVAYRPFEGAVAVPLRPKEFSHFKDDRQRFL